jgi:hypothetical protein
LFADAGLFGLLQAFDAQLALLQASRSSQTLTATSSAIIGSPRSTSASSSAPTFERTSSSSESKVPACGFERSQLSTTSVRGASSSSFLLPLWRPLPIPRPNALACKSSRAFHVGWLPSFYHMISFNRREKKTSVIEKE